MKKKISVEIHQPGETNDTILRAVASFNKGDQRLSLVDIVGWLNLEKCAFPSIRKGIITQWQTEPDTRIHISEDNGKTFTLTLSMREIEELKVNEITEELTNVMIAENL